VRKVQSPKSKVQGRKQNARASRLNLAVRMKRVKLLLTDVDGVLTDGTIFITTDGEFKQFSIQDGLGMVIWRRCGLKVGWISARPSVITTRRAEELKIDYLSQERTSKVAAAEKMIASAGVSWDEVCFVGDDVVDLCLLQRAGVAATVANAIPEAKAMSHYVTRAYGGHGAVREIITMILETQGRWDDVVQGYLA
jgi:3-deoxy-D-manno-octulosonate 8-phosphate phosphatase (KDO 8-P phosphatase)